MTQGGPASTPGQKALAYAEQTLGVHTVYDEVRHTQEVLSALREQLYEARKKKRTLDAEYTDVELTFIAETRGQLADMSQAQFDRHIKGEVNSHPQLRAKRGALAELTNLIDQIETAIANSRGDVEIGVARLHELGGYLGYLAEIKRAETAQKYPPAVAVQSPTTEDWPSASAVAGGREA